MTVPLPHNLPECLERLKVESGQCWLDIARCLGVNPLTIRSIRRWRHGESQPNRRSSRALLDLGRAHLLAKGRPNEQEEHLWIC